MRKKSRSYHSVDFSSILNDGFILYADLTAENPTFNMVYGELIDVGPLGEILSYFRNSFMPEAVSE